MRTPNHRGRELRRKLLLWSIFPLGPPHCDRNSTAQKQQERNLTQPDLPSLLVASFVHSLPNSFETLTMAYYCPGWDAVTATDILMFDSLADANAFTTQRDHVIALGEAARTPADAANYIDRLSLYWNWSGDSIG